MRLICNTCKALFTTKRSDAKYCSPRCRTQASRKRTRARLERKQADLPKPKRRPLPDQFRDKARDLRNAVEGLERVLSDDRLPKYRAELAELYGSDLERHAKGLHESLAKLEGK